jgi:hypothetical protein
LEAVAKLQGFFAALRIDGGIGNLWENYRGSSLRSG